MAGAVNNVHQFLVDRLPLEDGSEEGIKAIIFLQGKADIMETHDSAEKGWNNLTQAQRMTTFAFYTLLGGKLNLQGKGVEIS